METPLVQVVKRGARKKERKEEKNGVAKEKHGQVPCPQA